MINICCLLIFILCKEKIEAWFLSLVSREFHGVESTTFLSRNQQKMLKIYEQLNIFFYRYSYKNSCFSELVYNSSVLSYKRVLKDLALDLVGSFEGFLYFVYNIGQPYRIQISLRATCTHMGQLLHLSSYKF